MDENGSICALTSAIVIILDMTMMIVKSVLITEMLFVEVESTHGRVYRRFLMVECII